MSDSVWQRLLSLQEDRARLLADQVVSAVKLDEAEQRLRAAESRPDRAGDLMAAAVARSELLCARQTLATVKAEIAGRAASIAYLAEEIDAMRNMIEEAGRLSPDAAPAPWRVGPGAAGRVGIYDRNGGFVGEIQSAIDARIIVSFINRATRSVEIEGDGHRSDT